MGAFTLVMVLLIGRTSKGATRWISIGGFAFQPSEFVKIILIITLATFVYNLKYATKRDKVKTLPWLSSISILGLTGIYAGLIIAEKSFSNTAQICNNWTYLFTYFRSQVFNNWNFCSNNRNFRLARNSRNWI